MALEIVWSPQANHGLEKAKDYLEEEWTAVEILNLEKNLEDLLNRISHYPEICPATRQHKNIRKGFVIKTTTLFIGLIQKNGSSKSLILEGPSRNR